MIVRGEFAGGRPYVTAVVILHITSPSIVRRVSFLVDSGADRTLISPGDYRRWGVRFDSLGSFPAAEPTGVGGSVSVRVVPAKLLLASDRGTPVQIDVACEMLGDAAAAGLPSLLGRDVLDEFRLVIDRKADIVALIDSRSDL